MFDDADVTVELISGHLTITQPYEIGMYGEVFTTWQGLRCTAKQLAFLSGPSWPLWTRDPHLSCPRKQDRLIERGSAAATRTTASVPGVRISTVFDMLSALKGMGIPVPLCGSSCRLRGSCCGTGCLTFLGPGWVSTP